MPRAARQVLGPDAAERAVAELIGVSRLGRITGLDRAGVEVACAVRPRGHVLQVSNGKGRTFEAARRGALMEAAELAFAERVPLPEVVFGSARELKARVGAHAVWTPDALGSAGALVAPELWDEEVILGWRRGTWLERGEQLLIPACAVHCPPAGGPLLGPLVVRWSSNGSAVHLSVRAAQRHALFEAIERDQLARSLPEGWTEAAVRARLLGREGWPGPLLRMVARMERGGFQVFAFDLTPARGLGIPVAGVLLLDREQGPIPLTAGYAAAADPARALEGALLEAAQSRLTEIHGAREDVEVAAREEARAFGAGLGTVRPRRALRAMPRLTAAQATVPGLVRLLNRRGHEVAAVRLSGEHVPVEAWKVIVRGFLVTELL
jgi:ribosomal protein S12 methylthiotransferase accessory factor